jgi:hypothetical protein
MKPRLSFRDRWQTLQNELKSSDRKKGQAAEQDQSHNGKGERGTY